MKFRILCVLVLGALALSAPSRGVAMPMIPGPITITQPDGSSLSVRAYGDEWYSFTETEDGYSIVKNEDGWWVYADLDDAGRYAATQFRVHDATESARALLDRVGQHLREDGSYVQSRRREADSRPRTKILDRLSALGKRGVTNLVVPVLLIQFTDLAHEGVTTQPPLLFDQMLNEVDYNDTGSLRDYYQEISYGDLNITAHVIPVWLTSDKRHDY